MSTLNYFDPQTLAKLRSLRLRATHLVEGYVAGLHASPLRGFSIEFAEHRQYAPGDDLRYVDWKLFARTDKFYLKQFEDETNLIGYLVVDVSESMTFRSDDQGLSKLEYAQLLAAHLAWLVVGQNDSVALATFDRELRSVVRPASGPGHLKELVEILDQPARGEKTSAGPIFHELASRWKRRGIVVVLSDFLDDVKSMLAGLAHLRHRQHDVLLLHLLDRAEIDFPYEGSTLFKGLEAWPELTADPQLLRDAYQAEFKKYQQALEGGCRSQGIHYYQCTTDQPLDRSIAEMLGHSSARSP